MNDDSVLIVNDITMENPHERVLIAYEHLNDVLTTAREIRAMKTSPFNQKSEALRKYGLPHILDISPDLIIPIIAPFIIGYFQIHSEQVTYDFLFSEFTYITICKFLSLRYELAISDLLSTKRTHNTEDYFILLLKYYLDAICIDDLQLTIQEIEEDNINNIQIPVTQENFLPYTRLFKVASLISRQYYLRNFHLVEFDTLLNNLFSLKSLLDSKGDLIDFMIWIQKLSHFKVLNCFKRSKIFRLAANIGMNKELFECDEPQQTIFNDLSPIYSQAINKQDRSFIDIMNAKIIIPDNKFRSALRQVTATFSRSLAYQRKLLTYSLFLSNTLHELPIELNTVSDNMWMDENQVPPVTKPEASETINQLLEHSMDYVQEWDNVLDDIKDILESFDHKYDYSVSDYLLTRLKHSNLDTDLDRDSPSL